MMNKKRSAEKTVRDIRRATRRKYSAEEKIRIVIEGLRGEDSIAELCRREGINANVYYRWSKEFMEAGKKRLAGDVVREATTDEVKELRAESAALKEALAEQLMSRIRWMMHWPLPGWIRLRSIINPDCSAIMDRVMYRVSYLIIWSSRA